MIAPQVDAPQVSIAEDQEEYKTLTGALVKHPAYGIYGTAMGIDHNTLLLAFRPSVAESARLAAGEDIYVSLLTFGSPMQPIIVCVGKNEAAAIYGIGATE